MTPTPTEIERIVREVLAALGGGAPSCETTDETSSQATTLLLAADGTSAKPAPGEVIVQARVVTLAELDGRLASARRLIVPAGAVVTPAVRDELLRRKIAISHAAAANGQGPEALRLVAYVVARKYDPGPLGSALEKTGIGFEPHRSECLIASTDALAAEVKKHDTLGLLLTRHTAIGLCLANRHAGVRAIFGCSPSGVTAGAEAVGANVLVANTATPFFELRQIVGNFCRGGVKQCPEVFREQLG
jgi:hypothetical protein